MKINVPVTKIETIHLSEEDQLRITREYISKRFDFPANAYVKENGDLCHQVEYVTSHSWFEEQVIREATQQDREIYTVLKRLHSVK